MTKQTNEKPHKYPDCYWGSDYWHRRFVYLPFMCMYVLYGFSFILDFTNNFIHLKLRRIIGKT